MATITNFYEELGLNPKMTANEISEKLDQLEKVWRSRELYQPEKAAEMISLVQQAKETFADEETKKLYDLQDKNDVGISIETDFSLWYDKAISYFESKEYDLAKLAIEKAVDCNPNKDFDDDFLSYAADIYRFNNEFARALDYINKALLRNPDNCFHYLLKSAIYTMQKDDAKAIKEINKSLDVSKKAENLIGQGWAYGFLAKVSYLNKNWYQAYTNAHKAIEFGDPSGEGNKTINLLYTPRYITKDELKEYHDENNAFEQEIKGLLKKIISADIEAETSYGWLLWTQINQEYCDPYLHVMKEQKKWEHYLTRDGKYLQVLIDNTGAVCNVSSCKKWTVNSEGYSVLAEIGIGDYSDEIIERLDIQELNESIGAFGFSRHQYYPYNLSDEMLIRIPSGDAVDPNFSQTIFTIHETIKEFTTDTTYSVQRITGVKGLGFYKRLLDVWDNCQKKMMRRATDTKAFTEESVHEIQVIKERYSTIRSNFEQEKAGRLAKANEDDKLRDSIQREINSLEVQMKSLGLFDFKKKGKIKEEIEQKRLSLSAIVSSEKVEETYRIKLAEINSRETAEIDSIKAKLKNKYPYASV